MMSKERVRCPWCGKDRVSMSEWEQKHRDEWRRMCKYCANVRLRNPYSGLLMMRKVEQ